MKTVFDVMTMISTEYDRFSLSEERVKLWEYQLSDMGTETIYAAAMHYVSSGSPHPPTIGQIRRHCVDLKFGELSPVSGADAWIEVLSEIQKPDGSFLGLRWEIREALRGVGTIFDLKRPTNLSFERTHFIKSYDSVAEKQATERYALPDVKQMVQLNAPALLAKQEPRALLAMTERKPYAAPVEEPYVYVGAGAHSAGVEQEMHARQMKRVAGGFLLDFEDPYYHDRRMPSQEEIRRLRGISVNYEPVSTI